MMSIYLDNAATTQVSPEAVSAAVHVMTTQYGNPSSRHSLGLTAAAQVKNNRATIAATLGCLPEELFFTSGGTESDNWAVSIATNLGRRIGKHIITTAFEHAAVLEPIRALEQQGYAVTYLPSDPSGHFSLSDLSNALRPDTVLVSLMLVNNETGAIQPIADAAQLVHRTSALFHTDAVQGFLKMEFSPKTLGVDLLTLSAHKIAAMKGSGALYIRKGLKPRPLLRGGGQENNLRSGTEFTPQIAAFAAACQFGSQNLRKHIAYLNHLKTYTLQALRTVPGLVVVSAGDAPHICAISMPGFPSEMLVRDLSDRGICVSSGSACHKGKPSHVFAAMKLQPDVLLGILRISFSVGNTKEDADALVSALIQIAASRISLHYPHHDSNN
ncbi:MAG: cysteine desulfurase family protein [Evtepia sp.]